MHFRKANLMKKYLDDLDNAFASWGALEKNKIGKIVEHRIIRQTEIGKKEETCIVNPSHMLEKESKEIDEDFLDKRKRYNKMIEDNHDVTSKTKQLNTIKEENRSRYHKPSPGNLFLYELLIFVIGIIFGFNIEMFVLLMIAGIVVYYIWYAICYTKVSNEARKITRFNVETRYGCIDVDRIEPIIHDQVKIIHVLKERDMEDQCVIGEIMHVIDDFEDSARKNSGKIVFTQSFISKCIVSLVNVSDSSKARLMTYGTSILAHQDASPEVIINLQKNFLAALQICMNEHLSETRKHEQEMLESVAKNSF